MKAKGKRQKAKSKIQNWGVTVFLLWGVGCGYQFSGRSESFPKDVQTIFVEPFVNRTRDVGVEREITSALRSEFYRQGQLRVVDRADQADALLSGVVRSLDNHVVAVNRKDEVLQFETAMVVDIHVRRRSPDELLWRSEGTRLTELYSGSRAAVVTTSSEFLSGTLNPGDLRRFTDVRLTEDLGREARGRLVDRLARELHQRLMEMF
jgi:hypothetical protein